VINNFATQTKDWNDAPTVEYVSDVRSHLGTLSQPVMETFSSAPASGDLQPTLGNAASLSLDRDVKWRTYSVGRPHIGWATLEHLMWHTIAHSEKKITHQN